MPARQRDVRVAKIHRTLSDLVEHGAKSRKCRFGCVHVLKLGERLTAEVRRLLETFGLFED